MEQAIYDLAQAIDYGCAYIAIALLVNAILRK